MKNFFVLLFACALSNGVVNAQIAKGDLFLGASIGNTSYTSATDDYIYVDGSPRTTTIKTYGLVLNPMLGVFVTDHLIAGGTLGLNYTTTKTNTNTAEGGVSTSLSTVSTYTLEAGPFLRYYFFDKLPSRNLFFLQGQGTVGTGSGTSSGSGSNDKSTNTSTGTVNDMFTYTGGGSVGFTHFIGKDRSIGLDVAVGYQYSYEKSTDVNDTYTTTTSTTTTATTTKNFDVTTHTNGLTLSAGFHWFIARKNKG